ncbi:ATP-binding cassette domain-containing protein [Pseudonocardia sp. DSM 110487]|uniref:ABC transporter ATP-binding protein n=1 Tax=Pseudonocardia sp. DSM 110487 TaxID=2865833 RepID=UPI001C69EE47|nr:ATP-binding cassette domain-containing protein [Pseudonocardia sp. DSM 110487]QYN31741.1 ATP-binding cassette domain-containing protein [Pseudonocardia sp. DSM 110487]
MSAEHALLEVRNLRKSYPTRTALGTRGGEVHAVNGISFDLREGECYGLVGESGCGKTTTGRLLQGMLAPSGGTIAYRGTPLSSLSRAALRAYRSDVQMIFQDPYSALNPRKRVGRILEESLKIQGATPGRELRSSVIASLEAVGLSEEHFDRYPHEFSGGQRQRIGIARALIVSPRIILCDEPVSALDVSIQAQILNLLRRLQRELGLTYLFISHDLSVVRYIADRVGVMHRGELVEEGTTEEIFARPRHPYTKSLLAAVPARHPAERKRRPTQHDRLEETA